MVVMFSVFDSKASAFIQPFFTQSRGVAIRSFKAAAMDPAHDFHKFSGDFTLFELGSFDMNTGKFDMHSQPEMLALAATLIEGDEDAI